MVAYVIGQVEVTDPETYERYKKLAPPTIAKYGGRYLARGGAMEVLEGEWPYPRLVVAEFPSMEDAKRWYHSPEYADAKAIRADAARANLAVVEGL